ncbi:tRNA (guanine-N(7)-)-methyltransferase [Gulbenkiania indica]|uniref:tRNA (guanine-N(7)-)-methyltransferase n=1 Tax=Gulbenkiania indica TaxID=375574 RepID=A0A0K6GT26_9NEIS|nr:tRNA (guanosine(46)-N7)-methyltransferase TrmB [Gulbenkiania indica]CUA81656.1 tRNA (guanine-N(7)-)-methyltransferase [Gulbenkiania indica]
MDNPAFQRSIRSFVLRQGHLSAGQQRAIDQGMPRFGIEYAPARLDLNAAFGRTAPKILEIGFGMGGATAEIAAANPDVDYLGIEVHSPGVGNLLKLIDEKQLTNLRIIRHDAVEVLDMMLAPDVLDGVHIFFPDPWPKKRHHKRRLIQAPLVEKLVSRLKPGGYLHAATDWEEYAQQILEVFSANPGLENTAEGFAPRPAYRPLTKFEQRGIRLGHGVWDIIFRRAG